MKKEEKRELVDKEAKKKLRKRKFEKVKKEVKKGFILILIGFIGGIVYYKILIEEPKTIYVEKPILIKEEKQEEVCGYDEVTCKIKKVAEEKGIDWKIAVAISKHETGNYTSYAFKELHNPGGMMHWNGKKMVLKTFTTTDDGINAFVDNLKKNYFDMGLTTIEQIGNKYCPVGVNDNGLNKYWIPKVTYFYNELNQK